MRRKDREVTDTEKITEILQKGQIIHLGLVDGDYPYVLPLHYGYEIIDHVLVFYMHGAKEGHKIDLINKYNKAGFEIDCDIEMVSGGEAACMYGSYYASIAGRGELTIVDDIEEKIHGLNVLMRSQTGRDFSIDNQMAASVCVLKLSVKEYTAKSRAKLPRQKKGAGILC